MVDLYLSPSCTSCRKARAWLDKHSVPYTEHNILTQPMTNDDIITCLLFLDDMTLENGPLEVVLGSHRGPLYSHWHNGVFTGAVDPNIITEQKNKIVSCTGKAGSVCLMHSSLISVASWEKLLSQRDGWLDNTTDDMLLP